MFPEATIAISDPIPALVLPGCHEPALEMAEPLLLCPVGLQSTLRDVRAWGSSGTQGSRVLHTPPVPQAASRGQPWADLQLQVWKLRLGGIHCLGKRQVLSLTISQNPSM